MENIRPSRQRRLNSGIADASWVFGSLAWVEPTAGVSSFVPLFRGERAFCGRGSERRSPLDLPVIRFARGERHPGFQNEIPETIEGFLATLHPDRLCPGSLRADCQTTSSTPSA